MSAARQVRETLVPFDLFVSHASSFKAAQGKGGLFSRRPPPIAAAAFEQVMSKVDATRRPDGDYWLRHPEDQTPWLAARLSEQGAIVLSCSYTNHRYIRNFLDAFDLGLRVAQALGASVFEEVGGEEVTAKNIDALLDAKGEYVKLQALTFQHACQQLHQAPGGPMEYPVGPQDLVGEYFVLHLTLPPEAPNTLADILARVSFPREPTAVTEEVALFTTESGASAAKIIVTPDRRMQVWPSHGEAPFAETAGVTLAAFEALERAYPGTATFDGRPLTDSLRSEVSQRASGLGVEFFEWVSTLA